MSTKIYNAYKINSKDPWQAIWVIRDEAVATVRSKLYQLYRQALHDIDIEDDEYVKYVSKYQQKLEHKKRLSYVHDKFRSGYKNASQNQHLDPYNFDSSIVVYQHESQFFIRTRFDHSSLTGNVFKFIDGFSTVIEDFHYQNQSDKPDDISQENWDERQKVWDKIFECSPLNICCMLIDVCTYDVFYAIDPTQQLIIEMDKNPPQFASHTETMSSRLKEDYGLFKKVVNDNSISISHSGGDSIDVVKQGKQWMLRLPSEHIVFLKLSEAIDRINYEYMPQKHKRFIENFIARNATVISTT